MKKLFIASWCLFIALCACKREPIAEPDPENQNEEPEVWVPDPNDAYTATPFVQVKVTKGTNPTAVAVGENSNAQNRSQLLDMSGYHDPNFVKRGTCFNNLPQTVADTLTRGALRWGYNWAASPSGSYIGKGRMLNFYPMQWGAFSALTGLESSLKSRGADIILGFNEPMMTGRDGGCAMTPKRAAELWPQLEELALKYHVKLASPALTYGYEAIEGVKYGSPEAWMDKFISEYKKLYDGRTPRFDYLVLHSYMNWPAAVDGYVSKYAKRYKVKVLLTEFCAWEQGSDPWNNINNLEKTLFPDFSFQQASMTQKVEAMDQNPNVAGYAWFNAPGSANSIPWNAVYTGSRPTELGKVYAYMSTSNTEKYYQMGVFIPAAQYVTSSNYDKSLSDAFANRIIYGASTDTEFREVLPVELRRFMSPCFANYLINVPEAGNYTITLRFCSTGATTIVATCGSSSVLAEMTSTNGQWVDRTFNISLPAGQQALQFAATGSHADVRLSCWMFSKAN
ncbi:MAG: hypothetical protein J6Y77_02560 [Paludibacteraceae bacterium]|nr:hypothetical protein [Paludibacteraceae bacterium]